MDRLNMAGNLFMQSLGIPQEQITQKLVFDILSLQCSITPYSNVNSKELHWKIQGKKAQGGHLNTQKFKEKFSPLEK